MTKTQKGLLGTKLGMTQVWDADNRVVPVTVIQAGPCVVTQVRTEDQDGYTAVQIAFGAIDPRKVTKPAAGHFAKAGVTPRANVIEIRTADANEYTVGQELNVDTFEAGQLVDIAGVGDVMDDRGWHLDRQQGGLHLMVSPFHAHVVNRFLDDLAGAAGVVAA